MKIRLLFLISAAFPDSRDRSVAESSIDSLMKIYYPPNLPGAVIAVKQHDKII